MFEKFWANIIHYYTSKVHLRGLMKNRGFQTHLRGFCLCARWTATSSRLFKHPL